MIPLRRSIRQWARLVPQIIRNELGVGGRGARRRRGPRTRRECEPTGPPAGAFGPDGSGGGCAHDVPIMRADVGGAGVLTIPRWPPARAGLSPIFGQRDGPWQEIITGYAAVALA